MTTSSLNIKQFSVWVVNICGHMLCFSYIAFPLLVVVRTIRLFDNFNKLSMLHGFSRDLLEKVGKRLLRIRISSWSLY